MGPNDQDFISVQNSLSDQKHQRCPHPRGYSITQSQRFCFHAPNGKQRCHAKSYKQTEKRSFHAPSQHRSHFTLSSNYTLFTVLLRTFLLVILLVDINLSMALGAVKLPHYLDQQQSGHPYRPPPPHFNALLVYNLCPIVPGNLIIFTTFKPSFTRSQFNHPGVPSEKAKWKFPVKNILIHYSSISYHYSNVPFTTPTSRPSSFTLFVFFLYQICAQTSCCAACERWMSCVWHLHTLEMFDWTLSHVPGRNSGQPVH